MFGDEGARNDSHVGSDPLHVSEAEGSVNVRLPRYSGFPAAYIDFPK